MASLLPELILLGVTAVAVLVVAALVRRETRKFDERWGKR